MCGFFLIKYKNNIIEEDKREYLESLCNIYIKNRGPSYQESFKNESLFVYQSVLSIQSKGERSSILGPLGSSKYILYNGEIYGIDTSPFNSDTEYLFSLILENKLESQLVNLDGMYAICSVEQKDENNIKLNLYRDLAGEKHVWYYHDEDVFIVSSVPVIIRKYLEIVSKLKVNLPVLEDYIFRRHLISPSEHPISGIKQLLPGNKLSFDSFQWKSKLTEFCNFKSLFDFNEYLIYQEITNAEYNRTFSKVFDSVLQEMEEKTPKDRSSSSIISGGFDSSIVAASLLNSNRNIDLYTMLFDKKDKVAKNVPKILNNLNKEKYNFNHFEVNCSLETYTNRLKNSINILSSPVNTHSIPSASLVVEAAKINGNLVIYGGEGADESFLGYETYKLEKSKYSDYNRICSSSNLSQEALERVKHGSIQAHIEKFKEEVRIFLSSFEKLNEKEIDVKVESFTDTFIQLNNVGLLSADTVNSDLGIECRTPFTRKKLLKLALSTPPEKLTNQLNSFKLPIKEKFINYYGENSLMPKIGFAGFPNESALFLGDYSNWVVWEYFGWAYKNFPKMSINEAWKFINLEWFLRICF